MVRRIVGVIMLLIGGSGLILSLIGALITNDVIDSMGEEIDSALSLTSEGLDTVEDTLLLVRGTVRDVNGSLETVEITAIDLARTITETQPLLTELSVLVSEELPESLDAVNDTIPSLVQVAKAIDDTLGTLNRFRFERRILGIDINFDLGVDYEPEIPFDVSVQEIGDSMADLPDSLRGLETYVNVANENLGIVGDDVAIVADDLALMSKRVAETDPLLADYLRLVLAINDEIRLARGRFIKQLAIIKQITTVVMIWLGLTQIAPIYLGLELVTGRRMRSVSEIANIDQVDL